MKLYYILTCIYGINKYHEVSKKIWKKVIFIVIITIIILFVLVTKIFSTLIFRSVRLSKNIEYRILFLQIFKSFTCSKN